MKLFILLLFTLLFFNGEFKGQIPDEFSSECATPMLFDTLSIKSSSTNCSFFYNSERRFDDLFIPKASDRKKILQINLIFVQRNDGTGNFQEDNPIHQSIIDDWINIIRQRFSSITNTVSPNCNPNPNSYSFISDTKISFRFSKIYIQDDNGWNNNGGNLCPGSSNWYLDYLDNNITNDPSIKRGINIYFTEDSSNFVNLVEDQITTDFNGTGMMCAQYPSGNNFSRSSRIHVPDRFSKYWWMKNICPIDYGEPWDSVIRGWFLNEAVGIAHEIGHCLNLFHSCPGFYSTNGCDLALMSQCGNCPRNYIPPVEVGRMHAAVALTNVKNFVKPTFNSSSLEVSSTVNFDVEANLNQPIEIISGGKLNLTCKINMHPQSFFRIKDGGQFIIDNGVFSVGNERFNGIVVENNGLLEIRSYSLKNHHILVKDGGTLKITNNFSMSGNFRVDVESGGYICIEPEADITLQDELSVINLRSGFNSGVNTSVFTDPDSCMANPENASFTGNGSINTHFSQDTYVQNETISSDMYITGKNIYVGRAVTSSLPQGDVSIQNNSAVIFDAENEVVFEGGFEIQPGSCFEVVKE